MLGLNASALLEVCNRAGYFLDTSHSTRRERAVVDEVSKYCLRLCRKLELIIKVFQGESAIGAKGNVSLSGALSAIGLLDSFEYVR